MRNGTQNADHPRRGVNCLDCHTNATFHLNPDTRPQQARMRAL